jgi:hypothetical protein
MPQNPDPIHIPGKEGIYIMFSEVESLTKQP